MTEEVLGCLMDEARQRMRACYDIYWNNPACNGHEQKVGVLRPHHVEPGVWVVRWLRWFRNPWGCQGSFTQCKEYITQETGCGVLKKRGAV